MDSTNSLQNNTYTKSIDSYQSSVHLHLDCDKQSAPSLSTISSSDSSYSVEKALILLGVSPEENGEVASSNPQNYQLFLSCYQRQGVPEEPYFEHQMQMQHEYEKSTNYTESQATRTQIGKLVAPHKGMLTQFPIRRCPQTCSDLKWKTSELQKLAPQLFKSHDMQYN